MLCLKCKSCTSTTIPRGIPKIKLMTLWGIFWKYTQSTSFDKSFDYQTFEKIRSNDNNGNIKCHFNIEHRHIAVFQVINWSYFCTHWILHTFLIAEVPQCFAMLAHLKNYHPRTATKMCVVSHQTNRIMESRINKYIYVKTSEIEIKAMRYCLVE